MSATTDTTETLSSHTIPSIMFFATDIFVNLTTNNAIQKEGNDIITANEDVTSGGLVSDQALDIFVLLNNVILTGAISTIGSIFNIINIIVFYRLGFNDTVNITLLSLAVADLGALLTLVWKSVCFNPEFVSWDQIPFDYQGIQYFTAGWPHVCFARISSFITAFVTFERCLCIAMPLKVRQIITPKRTAIIMSAIFLVIMGSVAPVYFVISLGEKFFPYRNKSLVGLIYSDIGPQVEYGSLSFSIVIQIFSVVAVIICTIILVLELKRKSALRLKMLSTSGNYKESNSSIRDVKLVKMIVFISTIFIICFLPSAVNLITMVTAHEYSIRGRYSNLFVLTWAVFNTFESTNSTVNILVYIKLSSKYSSMFYKTFKCFGSHDDDIKYKPDNGTPMTKQ